MTRMKAGMTKMMIEIRGRKIEVAKKNAGMKKLKNKNPPILPLKREGYAKEVFFIGSIKSGK
jgi:hypothetical protein